MTVGRVGSLKHRAIMTKRQLDFVENVTEDFGNRTGKVKNIA